MCIDVDYKNILYTCMTTQKKSLFCLSTVSLSLSLLLSLLCVQYLHETADNMDGLPFKLHDFGFRGSTSVEVSWTSWRLQLVCSIHCTCTCSYTGLCIRHSIMHLHVHCICIYRPVYTVCTCIRICVFAVCRNWWNCTSGQLQGHGHHRQSLHC